jgi:hypothetical protein
LVPALLHGLVSTLPVEAPSNFSGYRPRGADDFYEQDGRRFNVDGTPMMGMVDLNSNEFAMVNHGFGGTSTGGSSADSTFGAVDMGSMYGHDSGFSSGSTVNINGAPMVGTVDINGDVYGSTLMHDMHSHNDIFDSSSGGDIDNDTFGNNDMFSSTSGCGVGMFD